MARPKGSKNKPKENGEAEGGGEQQQQTPGPGHNALTDDKLQALTFQHKRKFEAALASKKKADADFKNACKLAKAECGDDAVDLIKDLIALEDAEGEATLKTRIERQLRAARWMGLAIGAQPDLFGEDRTPSEDRAFAEGRRHGIAGEPCRPPHDPSTVQYRRYNDGFYEGQSVLAASMKPKADDAGEADPRPRHLKQREAETIGDADPTHRVVQ